MAWVGDWIGSRYQGPAEFASSYDAYFWIHLQKIYRQSGQCGSFKQIDKDDPKGMPCHRNLYSCKWLPSPEANKGVLIARVKPSYCDSYISNKLVSLKIIVNGLNQIEVVLRDEDGDGIDAEPLLARRSKDVRIAPSRSE